MPALAAAGQVVDIGSGAGFPGLVLAAALPHAGVDLLESVARKCDVIERLAAAAKLANARAVRARAEEWAAAEGVGAYDAATARAVGSLPVLLEYAAPLLRLGGTLVCWKGRRDPDEERAGASAAAIVGMSLTELIAVKPFARARNRHLHAYVKVAPTPERFPRRPGTARKRPLA